MHGEFTSKHCRFFQGKKNYTEKEIKLDQDCTSVTGNPCYLVWKSVLFSLNTETKQIKNLSLTERDPCDASQM